MCQVHSDSIVRLGNPTSWRRDSLSTDSICSAAMNSLEEQSGRPYVYELGLHRDTTYD